MSGFMSSKIRDQVVDLVKGVAIILMICGHAPCNGSFRSFIYLFHMPIFFMISGYFNRIKVLDSKGYVDFAWRRFKRLLLVAIVWNCLFVLLNNVLYDLGVYTDDVLLLDYVNRDSQFVGKLASSDLIRNLIYALASVGDTQLGGALWFVKALFWVSVIYAAVEFVSERVRIDSRIAQGLACILCVIGLTVGFYCQIVEKLLFFIRGDDTLKGYLMFHAGRLICDWKRHSPERANRHLAAEGGLALCSFAVLLIILKLSGGRELEELPCFVAWYVVSGVAGWFLMMSLGRLWTTMKSCSWITNAVVYIGMHTMPIIIFHFLAFKFVNYFGTLVYGHPRFVTAAFPWAYDGFGWLLIYITFSLAFCLSVDWMWGKIRSGLSRYARPSI